MLRSSSAFASTFLLFLACGGRTGSLDTSGSESGTGDEAESGNETNESGDAEGTGDGDGDGDGDGELPDADGVDVVFIVDNSGDMGVPQGQLAQAIGTFVTGLEGADIDYRIAVTTTDNGNPWCGATTTPEAGNFVLSSCRGRLQEFTFTGTNPPTVVDDVACTNVCAYGKAELDDLMKPTSTTLDPVAKRRPWVENVGGSTNVPNGITTIEALQCFLPQGIAGCGFESPLESAYKGLTRTVSNAENQYGFLRDGAALALVFVSSEVDCSYKNEWKEIFEASGNKVFWSDPDAQYPTSAVCWNAGVACTGGPVSYDACDPQDYDVQGNPTGDQDVAVLQPLSRYQTQLQGHIDDGRAVVTFGLLGVPSGYANGGAEIEYADSPDPSEQESWGIGPGCESGDISALPPVRMRELAEQFKGGQNPARLYSLCDGDYGPGMSDAASVIAELME